MKEVPEARQQEIADKWVERCTKPGEISQQAAIDVTRMLYRDFLKHPVPPDANIEIHPSPKTAWARVAELEADSEEKYNEMPKGMELPSIAGAGDAVFYAAIEIALEAGVPKEKCDVQLLKLADVSWVWPMEEYCIFADLPRTLKVTRGDNLQLHCDDGPAVEYSNGEKLWFIEGHPVDEQIIMRPETQTVEQILNEGNADIRAIRAERHGWLSLLQKMGDVKRLDERRNDVEGTYEVLYKTPLGNKFVATCITGKIPVLSVPDEVKTCEAAQLFFGGELPILGVDREPWWKKQEIDRPNVIGRT